MLIENENMSEAIERIKSLLRFLEEERTSKTGYGFLIFELKQILELLKGDESSLEAGFRRAEESGLKNYLDKGGI